MGGTLRAVSANLLNYYNSFANCRNGVNGAAIECRGASNTTEFTRQAAKAVSALLATQADVVGLVEVENDGYATDSAIADLVSRLNAATAPGTWAFVNADAGTGQTDALGNDGIRVAMVYQTARVAPVGQTAVLNTGYFGQFELLDVSGDPSLPHVFQQRNRPSLAQSFQDVSEPARVITVVINHLISKGATCERNVAPGGPDPDTGDGQGACNKTRVGAMSQLLDWLGTDPTGVGDADYVLLGDFNAYTREDPIRTLEAAGYVELERALGQPGTYSYAFDGQWGSLDHAVVSPSLFRQVTGVAAYHINADEPSVLDYNTEFKSAGQVTSLYAPNQFRAADHDPVVVGLDACATVKGTSGRDTLGGSVGSQCITGGLGSDTLTGGGGRDFFVYTSQRDTGDVIVDFTPAQDVIGLSQLLRGLGYGGGNALTDGWVRVIASGADGAVVQVDFDGPGAASSEITSPASWCATSRRRRWRRQAELHLLGPRRQVVRSGRTGAQDALPVRLAVPGVSPESEETNAIREEAHAGRGAAGALEGERSRRLRL